MACTGSLFGRVHRPKRHEDGTWTVQSTSRPRVWVETRETGYQPPGRTLRPTRLLPCSIHRGGVGNSPSNLGWVVVWTFLPFWWPFFRRWVRPVYNVCYHCCIFVDSVFFRTNGDENKTFSSKGFTNKDHSKKKKIVPYKVCIYCHLITWSMSRSLTVEYGLEQRRWRVGLWE